jgi:hypothetical protein
MNLSDWFRKQLQTSAQGFVWGAEQVPVVRRMVQPPDGLGEWSAARHIYHLLYYEQTLALPSMQQWLGKACPVIDEAAEDLAWAQNRAAFESLEAEFLKVRAEQIALLANFDRSAWQTTRACVWGPVTLQWVVSKTYQHTAEHISDVMRLALFWDRYAAR